MSISTSTASNRPTWTGPPTWWWKSSRPNGYPESVVRDRSDKYNEYQRGGVQEFWLLDLEQQRAEFFALDTEGRYQPIAIDAEGIFHSTVLPGFWLQTEWLWSEPLPKMLEVLTTLGIL